MPKAQLSITLHHPQAKAPDRGSKLAAGLDLYACEDATIKPQERSLVNTGIQIALPTGTYGRIAARSGLAWKHGLIVGAGVIDADYEGIVRVLIFNNSAKDYEIKVGDSIAQLIVEKIEQPKIVIVTRDGQKDQVPQSDKTRSVLGFSSG